MSVVAENAKKAFTSPDNAKSNYVLIIITMVSFLVLMFFPVIRKIMKYIYRMFDRFYAKHLDPII